MKIGIFVFNTGYSLDPAVLAKRAEELGFESFWVPEHCVIPVKITSPHRGSPDGVIPESYSRIMDPFIALARASAVTQTIKLGTGICLVPERNPLQLAKEVASLDHFSGGRFIFGIGAGWLKEESEIMGADFPHRWSQTREAVLAMKELWTKDEAEYHGKYYDFPPVRLFPKPTQKPHPPILLGGNSKNVLKRVVEWGDGWMPGSDASIEEVKRGRATLSALAERAGRDPRSIEILAFGQSGVWTNREPFGKDGRLRPSRSLASVTPAQIQLRDRQLIEDLEGSGVDRVTIWLTPTERDEALAEMEAIAREVL